MEKNYSILEPTGLLMFPVLDRSLVNLSAESNDTSQSKGKISGAEDFKASMQDDNELELDLGLCLGGNIVKPKNKGISTSNIREPAEVVPHYSLLMKRISSTPEVESMATLKHEKFASQDLRGMVTYDTSRGHDMFQLSQQMPLFMPGNQEGRRFKNSSETCEVEEMQFLREEDKKATSLFTNASGIPQFARNSLREIVKTASVEEERKQNFLLQDARKKQKLSLAGGEEPENIRRDRRCEELSLCDPDRELNDIPSKNQNVRCSHQMADREVARKLLNKQESILEGMDMSLDKIHMAMGMRDTNMPGKFSISQENCKDKEEPQTNTWIQKFIDMQKMINNSNGTHSDTKVLQTKSTNWLDSEAAVSQGAESEKAIMEDSKVNIMDNHSVSRLFPRFDASASVSQKIFKADSKSSEIRSKISELAWDVAEGSAGSDMQSRSKKLEGLKETESGAFQTLRRASSSHNLHVAEKVSQPLHRQGSDISSIGSAPRREGYDNNPFASLVAAVEASRGLSAAVASVASVARTRPIIQAVSKVEDYPKTATDCQTYQESIENFMARWQKGSINGIPLTEDLSHEVMNLKAGLGTGQTFGGSGSLPDLPWVSTTGSGPDGKTVSGVLYRYSRDEVRIVCACHGGHMTPREFVKHAGSTDLSNPERDIMVNSVAVVSQV